MNEETFDKLMDIFARADEVFQASQAAYYAGNICEFKQLLEQHKALVQLYRATKERDGAPLN